MFEVELKAKIKKREEVLILLNKLNPIKTEEVEYFDTYFDTSKKDFLKSEKELRVRKISNGNTRVMLTYKNEPFDEISKSKPEYEVLVDNHKNIITILNFLGYKREIQFSKKCLNISLTFNGQSILASLVNVPELGLDFIEVETLVKNLNSTEDAMKNLFALFRYLKIEKSAMTSQYYTDLVRETRNK